jgi:hypothetical protein
MSHFIHYRLINRLLVHLYQHLQQAKTTETPTKSLQEIRPFPKAQTRGSIKKGCKLGRSRVLTDMPEKHEIETLRTKKMKSNVAPQRKVVVNVLPGKAKQMKAKRSDVGSSSDEDLSNSFHGLSDVTLASMNLGLYISMRRKKQPWKMLSWRMTFLSSQGNGFYLYLLQRKQLCWCHHIHE